MRFPQRVIATDFRTGVSKKDGDNKDRKFVSFHCLDMDGKKFDIFAWNDNGQHPQKIDTPCLLECDFEMGVNRDGDPTLELVAINKKSPTFDLSKVFDSLKLNLEKV